MALVVYACLHVTRSTGALIGVVHTSACPVGDASLRSPSACSPLGRASAGRPFRHPRHLGCSTCSPRIEGSCFQDAAGSARVSNSPGPAPTGSSFVGAAPGRWIRESAYARAPRIADSAAPRRPMPEDLRSRGILQLDRSHAHAAGGEKEHLDPGSLQRGLAPTDKSHRPVRPPRPVPVCLPCRLESPSGAKSLSFESDAALPPAGRRERRTSGVAGHSSC